MNIKYQKFIDEYIQNGGNATQAAISAGYSNRTAYSIGSRLLKNVEVQAALSDRLKQLDAEAIAKDKEVLSFLSAVMRGQVQELVPVNTGKLMARPPCISDRLKAAALLAKAFGIDKPQDKPDTELTIRILKGGGSCAKDL